MSSFEEVCRTLTKEYPTRKGQYFERLMVSWLQQDPLQASLYDQVYRWVDWPYNGNKSDTGIDLVAHRSDGSGWVAIQCKFYAPTTYIQKPDIDSFLAASSRGFVTDDGAVEHFVHRIIISTSDLWSENAEAELRSQNPPVSRMSRSTLENSSVEWEMTYPHNELVLSAHARPTFSPRPHQSTAIAKVLEGLRVHDRGQLLMACGTGKTFTALRLAEAYHQVLQNQQHAQQRPGWTTVLVCVPSISLLSQTLREWTAQTTVGMRSIAICSDSRAAREAEDIAPYDLTIPVTTTPELLAQSAACPTIQQEGLQVIYTTYQSLEVVHTAQEQYGLGQIDLIICDEAHRTTGVTMAGDTPSQFARIHDASYIRGEKRLYMTATPRLYDDRIKAKAQDASAEMWSMDDEGIYGPVFHQLGFGEAVDAGLLTDYRVVVIGVDETVGAHSMVAAADQLSSGLTLDTASTMVGVFKALAKQSGSIQGTSQGFDVDPQPMHRVVAFARTIRHSRDISTDFPTLIDAHRHMLASSVEDAEGVGEDVGESPNNSLEVECQHVDGGMNAMERARALRWLKEPVGDMECRMLTNAQCLSEGVDVPALDAVVFFHPRKSVVDIVQSVGRVMRKAPGKNYGYIVLPIAIPADSDASTVLENTERYRVLWQVVNALRAHDARLDAVINSVDLNGDTSALPIDVYYASAGDPFASEQQKDWSEDSTKVLQQLTLFDAEQWKDGIYTRLVQKVGSRRYWEDWADDVADIAGRHITRIHSILDHARDTQNTQLLQEFDRFVTGLRGNLNDSITPDDAITMLAQHLVTAPVFDALFAEHDFASHNPVSRVMTRMVEVLGEYGVESENTSLESFYTSVRRRAHEVTSPSGKQEVVRELYERFFQRAFRKQAEALGIVYTPVDVVDFMLRATNQALHKHLGLQLTDEGVHILDPFTGTGTFLVQLLQSDLLDPHDLARKYAHELHAREIMLLAYYVATVNIETTYQALITNRARLTTQDDTPTEIAYEPFPGIALADSFQIHEDDDTLDLEVFRDNNERIERQKNTPIHVIIGNPPYSKGQTSANDLNENQSYPTLDARIADTYVALSSGTNKNSLYDSYLRAFRWATDRIGNRGVVAFISNGGWVDGNAADGVRQSMQHDFQHIYLINLRGNARTSGELRRQEGGNVFDSGSRATALITIGIKNPEHTGPCEIFYHDIGDYLSREDKLQILRTNTLDSLAWQQITPNEYGDWVNQRHAEFAAWPVLGDKKNPTALQYFTTYSRGLATSRDAWVYSFSDSTLHDCVNRLVDSYNQARHAYHMWADQQGEKKTPASVNTFLKTHPEHAQDTRIKWSHFLMQDIVRNTTVVFEYDHCVTSLYRPFCAQHGYYDKVLNEAVYQLPSIFPSPHHTNIGFYVVNPGSAKPFSLLGTTMLLDLAFYGSNAGQFFPRFTWEPTTTESTTTPQQDDQALFPLTTTPTDQTDTDGGESIYGIVGEIVDGYQRVDNITPPIRHHYQEALGIPVSGDDIFHYLYALLHHPHYRTTYAADLKKMLPHIPLPTTQEVFFQYAQAGQTLLHLHTHYEEAEPYPLTITVKQGSDPEDPATWQVKKMRRPKITDPDTGKKTDDITRIIYNPHVTISGIPEIADDYTLGSRSALAWIIDRYQIKTDKKSGITNDPNQWGTEHHNPRYIVDLIQKITTVAVTTTNILKDLPQP